MASPSKTIKTSSYHSQVIVPRERLEERLFPQRLDGESDTYTAAERLSFDRAFRKYSRDLDSVYQEDLPDVENSMREEFAEISKQTVPDVENLDPLEVTEAYLKVVEDQKTKDMTEIGNRLWEKANELSQTLSRLKPDGMAQEFEESWNNFIEGERLKNLLDDKTRLPVMEQLRQALQTATALLEAIRSPDVLEERLDYFIQFLNAHPQFKRGGFRDKESLLKIFLGTEDMLPFLRESAVLEKVLRGIEGSEAFEESKEGKTVTVRGQTRTYKPTNNNPHGLKAMGAEIGYERIFYFVRENRNADFSYPSGLWYQFNRLSEKIGFEEALNFVDRFAEAPGLALQIVAGNMGRNFRDEEVAAIIWLRREHPELKMGNLDLHILSQIGVIALSNPDIEKLKQLEKVRLTHSRWNRETEVHNTYRKLFTYFSLEELAATGLDVEGENGKKPSPFADFASLLMDVEHLLPETDLKAVAKRFQEERPQPSGYFKHTYLLARNWEDVFRIGTKIKEVAQNAEVEKIDFKRLAEEFPAIDDNTIVHFRNAFLLFAEDLKNFAEPKRIQWTEETRQKGRALKERGLRETAQVWLKNPGTLTNTVSNRNRLAQIDPVVLEVYDEMRKSRGLDNVVVGDAGETIQPFELRIGEAKTLAWYEKIADRHPLYSARRALALVSNQSGISLGSLTRKTETLREITYEYYFHGEEEVVRTIRLYPSRATLGVDYLNLGNLGEVRDTPMSRMENILLETTGAMVDMEIIEGTPTGDRVELKAVEMLVFEGKPIQEKMHPHHDGVLILGRDGVPHIEDIERIDGTLLGLSGTIDGRYKQREQFAAAVAASQLTVMQSPLFVKDGKIYPVFGVGVPWMKRALVTYGDGSFGFVETRQPVDNRTFMKLLVDVGVKDAMPLDTGNYDHYKDINGKENIYREGMLSNNRIMLYARRK